MNFNKSLAVIMPAISPLSEANDVSEEFVGEITIHEPFLSSTRNLTASRIVALLVSDNFSRIAILLLFSAFSISCIEF